MTRHLRGARLHAVQLAREHAIYEFGHSHPDLKSQDTFRAAQARQRNTRLIYRLAPGRAGGVSAMQKPSGEVVAQPDAKAAASRPHWVEVFRARGVNISKLD
eukprot:3113916-Pyramimonas_sp.AAC.1